MNEFKEEILQLLRRYAPAKATNNNKTPSETALPPLTNQQIVDVIHEALLITFNINLQNVEMSELKTPANEIVVTTPNAPDVLRMDYNQNLVQNRYKSFETKNEEKRSNGVNSMKAENGTLLSDKFSIAMDIKKNLDSLEENSKYMPKSDVGKKMMMYTIVEDSHKDLMKVVHRLEDLRELLLPEARPIRRLSAIMNLPKSQHQNPPTCSSSLRTTQRAIALTRRSMHQLSEDLPVTPTSSRPSLVMPSDNTSTLGKKPASATAGAAAAAEAAAAAAAAAAKPASSTSKLSQSHRSVSTLALATNSSKSSGIGARSSSSTRSPSKSRAVKNSKYAHVKSTIPKPTALPVKRKV